MTAEEVVGVRMFCGANPHMGDTKVGKVFNIDKATVWRIRKGQGAKTSMTKSEAGRLGRLAKQAKKEQEFPQTAGRPLTDALVESLEPAAKVYEVRCSKLTGFMLRVQPGGVKTYYVEYKRGKREKLGRSDILAADEARAKARETIRVKGKYPVTLEAKREAVETLVRPKEEKDDLFALIGQDYYSALEDAVKTRDEEIRLLGVDNTHLLTANADLAQESHKRGDALKTIATELKLGEDIIAAQKDEILKLEEERDAALAENKELQNTHNSILSSAMDRLRGRAASVLREEEVDKMMRRPQERP